MVSEAKNLLMAWMETDYSKHTYFRLKVKWLLEHMGALGTMGEMAPLIFQKVHTILILSRVVGGRSGAIGTCSARLSRPVKLVISKLHETAHSQLKITPVKEKDTVGQWNKMAGFPHAPDARVSLHFLIPLCFFYSVYVYSTCFFVSTHGRIPKVTAPVTELAALRGRNFRVVATFGQLKYASNAFQETH